MNQITAINQPMLDDLTAEAAASPRLRKNHNFHHADDDPCHRLMNAMEPGTYIPPHCHLDEGKDETVVILRGRLGLVEFDAEGNVTATLVMTPGGDNVAVHIPRGVLHTWVALEPGSVFLEAKAGPYHPFTPEELAPWAPDAGNPQSAAYLAKLEALFRPGK